MFHKKCSHLLHEAKVQIFVTNVISFSHCLGLDFVTVILFLHNWLKFGRLMSQSIPTGCIPPGNPGENFFERANPGHPGNFFWLIPCPGAKSDGQSPGGGAKFSHTPRNSPLSLQKSIRNSENIETVQIFCLENLTKLLYFGMKQSHSKVFKYSILYIQLKQ